MHPRHDAALSIRITDNPELRAICGNSSGGISPFVAAWHRPDQFRKALRHFGSFVDLRGGHNLPPLFRNSENKPLRVLLQVGEDDLDYRFGNWPLANQQMAKALAFEDHDHKLVFGTGAHNGQHGGAIFPDSLRWLWRNGRDQTPSSSKRIQHPQNNVAPSLLCTQFALHLVCFGSRNRKNLRFRANVQHSVTGSERSPT